MKIVQQAIFFYRRLRLVLHFLAVFIILGAATAKAQTCSVNAGVNSRICITGTMSLFGNATGLFSTAAEWALVSGPNVPTITSPTAATTTITGFVAGTYRFRYHAICSDAVMVSDTVQVIVDALPVFTAGIDNYSCGYTDTMDASLPIGASGVWSSLPLIGTVDSFPTFSSNAPNAVMSAPLGTYCNKDHYAIYTVTQGACVARDTAQISFGGQLNSSTTPQPDVTICGTFFRYPSVLYSGCNGSYSSTQLAGPSIATIENTVPLPASGFWPYYSNLIKGTYTFALEVIRCTGTTFRDTFNITVTSTLGTSFGVTGNRSLCFNEFDTVYFWTPLVAPLPGEVVIYNFSSLSKSTPGATTPFPTLDTIGNTLRMRNVSHPDTNATNDWSYNISYTVSNGTCSTMLNSSLNLHPPMNNRTYSPLVNLLCGATSGNIAIPNSGSHTGYIIFNGTVISRPSGAPNPTFSYNTFTGYTASGLVPGKYVFSFAFSRNVAFCDLRTGIVEVNVSAVAGASNAGTNQILACGVDSTVLAGNTPPAGQMGTWQLVSGPSGVILTNPNSASLTIKNLLSGVYTFRWSINSGSTCPSSADEMQVVVTPVSPVVDAGPDKTVCFGYTIPLTGNAPSLGTTGRWHQIGGSLVTIADSTAGLTSITGTVASSVYTFTWTLNNVCGSDTDTVMISTTSSQGPSKAIILTLDSCITTAGFTGTTLNATSPTVGSGLWSQISGPAIATIATPASTSTTVSGMGALGEYKFEWTVTSTGCDTLRDTVSIANRGTTAFTANGGNDKYLCADTLMMTATTPTLGVGTWTQITGSGTVIDNLNSPTTMVRNLAYGSIYDFVWSVNLGICPVRSDTVHVVVSALPSPAVARTDTLVCNIYLPSTHTLILPLTAIAPTSGVGAWSILQNTLEANSSITNPGLASTIGNFKGGITKVLWQVVNGACPASRDTVVVELVSVAEVGPANVNICSDIPSYVLTGTMPGSGSVLWTQRSGPSIATITQPNNQVTSITNLDTGIYVFRCDVTHPTTGCSSSDSVRITNYYRVIPNAGRDTIFCFNPSGTVVFLEADTPSMGAGYWSLLSGDGTVIISPGIDANPATALVSAGARGLHQFRWMVQNGVCQATDIKDVIIERLPQPTIAVSPLTACRDTFSVTGSTVSLAFNYAWSFPKGRIKDTSGIGLTGPIANNFLISDTNSIYLTITNPASGCTAIDSTSVIVDCAYLPLSLKFLNVQNKVKDCAVQIHWDFNLDANSKLQHFEVERSTDGRSYTNIASLSASTKSYIDIAQGNGHLYYRIKAVGVENEVAYTPTQAIETKNCGGSSVLVYPNPASVQLNILLQGANTNNQYEVIDALGRVVLRGKLMANSNNKVDMSDLINGSYIIRITTETEVHTEQIKIIK